MTLYGMVDDPRVENGIIVRTDSDGNTVPMSIEYYLIANGMPPDETDQWDLKFRKTTNRFMDWPLYSYAGQQCKPLIDMAVPLIRNTDESAHGHIWRGLAQAMAVICLG